MIYTLTPTAWQLLSMAGGVFALSMVMLFIVWMASLLFFRLSQAAGVLDERN